jgi:hypothetical protein
MMTKPKIVLKQDIERYVNLLQYLLEEEGKSITNDPNADHSCYVDHHNDNWLVSEYSPYVLSIPDLISCLK